MRDICFVIMTYEITYRLSFGKILIAVIGVDITSSIAQSFYNQCKIARVGIIIWKQAWKKAPVLSITEQCECYNI